MLKRRRKKTFENFTIDFEFGVSLNFDFYVHGKRNYNVKLKKQPICLIKGLDICLCVMLDNKSFTWITSYVVKKLK